MFRLSLPAILFLFLTTGAALACSCRFYETAEEHVAQTTIIFEGTVTKTDHPGFLFEKKETLQTTFAVTRAIKGEIKEEMIVRHVNGEICCICGVNFEEGESYLIFAYRNGKGELNTNSCSQPYHAKKDYERAFEALANAENSD